MYETLDKKNIQLNRQYLFNGIGFSFSYFYMVNEIEEAEKLFSLFEHVE